MHQSCTIVVNLRIENYLPAAKIFLLDNLESDFLIYIPLSSYMYIPLSLYLLFTFIILILVVHIANGQIASIIYQFISSLRLRKHLIISNIYIDVQVRFFKLFTMSESANQHRSS